MANPDIIITEREHQLNGFSVGRLLPFRSQRQVGPFVFIDHLGPAVIQSGNYLNVDQHPHIGLSTLTYVLDGAIAHKDSTGENLTIQTGDVAFMTAGKGVTHTERTPIGQLDGKEHPLHIYQIWVALPVSLEDMPPEFAYHSAPEQPRWKQDNCELTLVAGEAFGRLAPVVGFSPLFMVDVTCQVATTLSLKDAFKGELGIIIIHGSVLNKGERYGTKKLLLYRTGLPESITLGEHSRIILIGGEALPEERFLAWNFCSSKKEKLEQAKQDWQNKLFPKIDSDFTYTPYPDT